MQLFTHVFTVVPTTIPMIYPSMRKGKSTASLINTEDEKFNFCTMDLKKELDLRSKLMFLSRSLKIYEKISVIFLICDKPNSAIKVMEILLATDSKNLQNKAFFTWAKKQMLFSSTDWKERIAEVLAWIQNYRLVKYLGYNKDRFNKTIFTFDIKHVLYKLCEELNQTETKSLIISIDNDYNAIDSNKTATKSYLEKNILDWSIKNIISIDSCKRVNLVPLLKYLDNFNVNDIISDIRTVIDNVEFNLLKSIKTIQLENSLLDNYPITNKNNLGLCVIINEKSFPESDLNLKPRWGSNKDVARLQEVFTAYGFKIRVHTDVAYDDLIYLLNSYVRLISPTDSFFTLIILSHGSENVIYTSDSIPVSMNKIEMIFQAENCPNLIGKPKIFIIQSCQGQKWQKVLQGAQSAFERDKKELYTDAPNTPNPSNKGEDFTLVGPQKGDSIIAWSTVQGYASFRDKHNGSWYIEELCAELWKFGQITDLVDILTLVNNNLRSKTYSGQFMVPSLLSSLSGKIQFPYVEQNWLKGRQLMFKRLLFEQYFMEFIMKPEISLDLLGLIKSD